MNASDTSDRKNVVDNESAKQFIRDVFNQDGTGLSNLREGMDKVPSTYEKLIQGSFIQSLITENSGEAPAKLTRKAVPLSQVRITRKTSVAKIIPKEKKEVRLKVIKTIYTPAVSKNMGLSYGINKKGRVFYRNTNTGRFVSSGKMLREGDRFIKSNAKTKAEVERLIKLEFTKEN